MTPRDRFDHAGKFLAEHGIALVLTTSTATRGDAWCDATEQHGDDIAHVHVERAVWRAEGIGGWDYWADHSRGDGNYVTSEIRVSYRYDRPEHARRIVTAFRKAGCGAGWTGDVYDSVLVELLP